MSAVSKPTSRPYPESTEVRRMAYYNARVMQKRSNTQPIIPSPLASQSSSQRVPPTQAPSQRSTAHAPQSRLTSQPAFHQAYQTPAPTQTSTNQSYQSQLAFPSSTNQGPQSRLASQISTIQAPQSLAVFPSSGNQTSQSRSTSQSPTCESPVVRHASLRSCVGGIAQFMPSPQLQYVQTSQPSSYMERKSLHETVKVTSTYRPAHILKNTSTADKCPVRLHNYLLKSKMIVDYGVGFNMTREDVCTVYQGRVQGAPHSIVVTNYLVKDYSSPRPGLLPS